MGTLARMALFAGLAMGAVAAPAGAQPTSAPSLLLGGDVGAPSYDAAKEVEKADSFQAPVELTGSRIGLSPIEYCTLIISQGTLTGPALAAVYVNRGVLLFAEGQHQKALDDFDAAAKLDEANAAVHVNRGFTLIAMQRWAESIPALTRGIELQPVLKIAEAYYHRGVAHEETGNIRGAYYDYRKAAELNPEWEEPRVQLARFNVTRRAAPAQ